jgi:tagatose 6-phosphate kinase
LILTVTLNTAVDKTYSIPDFALDRVHRPEEWRICPGGKGINVSRVLNELGAKTLALGFAGGHNGGFIRQGLDAEGIPHDLVESREESRVCITIIDTEHGTQTEVNENGPSIQESELQALESRLKSYLTDADTLVLSGSIPPGIPPDIYARWIDMAKRAGVWVLLDSSGPAIAAGIEASPDAAKPNRREFTELSGDALFTAEEIVARSRDYVRAGVPTMLVSLGRAGAVAVTETDALMSIPPEIDFVSAVGSGDAFVAGFIFARHHGDSLEDALRLGTAAGAANAMTFGAGFCSKECINSLAAQVEIRKLSEEHITQ